jgi:hypothetical protein
MLKIYCVGVLKNGQMTECHIATSDLKEAKRAGEDTNKNVYEKIGDKYFLRKIYCLRNLLNRF